MRTESPIRTKSLLATSTLLLGLLGATTACAPAADAPRPTAETETAAAVDPIIGTWTMVSLETGTDGDLQETPYSGQIIFTESGTVAVQAMNPDQSAPDGPYTIGGYEAFYGDAEVDSDEGTFSVEVESAAVRDLIGQTLERNFEVSGDTLVLTPTDPAEGWRVTYERG